MRRKNPRVVIAGAVLLAMAMAFFFLMLSVASRSTDPVELMRTVGTVSGVVGGIAITMMMVGGFGKKAAPQQG
jgi:hypothetical protein